MAIYDAVNPTSQHRQSWKNHFEEHGIQTIFIESLCDDKEIIEQNVRNVKISSPDVQFFIHSASAKIVCWLESRRCCQRLHSTYH